MSRQNLRPRLYPPFLRHLLFFFYRIPSKSVTPEGPEKSLPRLHLKIRYLLVIKSFFGNLPRTAVCRPLVDDPLPNAVLPRLTQPIDSRFNRGYSPQGPISPNVLRMTSKGSFFQTIQGLINWQPIQRGNCDVNGELGFT